VYTSKDDIAKKPFYKTATLSNLTTFVDVELVKLFEASVKENIPYHIELGSMNWADWIKRCRKYWEEEKGLNIAYHAKTNSVWLIPTE